MLVEPIEIELHWPAGDFRRAEQINRVVPLERVDPPLLAGQAGQHDGLQAAIVGRYERLALASREQASHASLNSRHGVAKELFDQIERAERHNFQHRIDHRWLPRQPRFRRLNLAAPWAKRRGHERLSAFAP